MPADSRFITLVDAARQAWERCGSDDSLFSLAVPVEGIDPLQALPSLAEAESFQMLWDGAPGLCFAAAGCTQQLNLNGARRFELAQRFSDLSLARLIDASPDSPAQARPRVLLAFSFFAQSSERNADIDAVPSVQAVLPRWQLSRQGRSGWLRIIGTTNSAADARDLAEQLWLKQAALQQHSRHQLDSASSVSISGASSQQWQQRYRTALERGLELIEQEQLHKIVLAVRQSIDLTTPFDPLPLLRRLRRQQAGSCRFLWQRSRDDAFFGASPERLLSLRSGYLRSDALAGTAGQGDDGQALLRSDKDRREHDLVVETITTQLRHAGLTPLSLAEQLHPTPAVAGLPRREAMNWLRTLEPFERGNYAAPLGWIDRAGDAELRVAIRCGHAHGLRLDLTAGAGLVRGSIADRELQEVGLKLAVLADQLHLSSEIGERTQTPLER